MAQPKRRPTIEPEAATVRAREAEPVDLHAYPTAYLDCRRGSGIGHNWEWQGPYYQSAYGEIHRRAACSRCGGEKTTKRYKSGAYIPTSYTPPKDYSLAGGVTVQEMWTEMLSRNKVYRNELEAAEAVAQADASTMNITRITRKRRERKEQQ